MADVVGYSRLMGANEDDTIARLKKYRDIFSKCITGSNGRIVNAPGDSILAEFSSVHDAVSSAVQIQKKILEENAPLPEELKMPFRIGINLGDVVVDDDAIYGNGVNVAARLESLAEPGGVTISGSVYDSVRGQLPLGFKFTGEQSVKNIANPVATYRVEFEGSVSQNVKRVSFSKYVSIIVLSLLIIVLAIYFSTATKLTQDHQVDSKYTLPKQPSIAVLPLTNMSGDADQEYFSDGFTDTLITSLSNLRDILVIARNSTFVYKGKSTDVREVGRDLGVQHVLQGSVQRADNRIRINVQLLDTTTGSQIWAEKYDREFVDLFAIQDEITDKILTALDVALVEGEQAQSWRRTTKNPYAYEAFLRGWELRQKLTREDNAKANAYFEQALDLDPKFAAAIFGLGTNHMAAAYSGWSASTDDAFEAAMKLAQKAIEIEPGFAGAYDLYGELLFMHKKEHLKGLEYMRKAVNLTPNSARYNWTLGVYLCNCEKIEEGLEYVDRGFRLNPHPPGWFYEGYGRCHLISEKYDSSIEANKQATEILPDFIWAYVELTIAYMATEREDEARAAAKQVLRINPKFSSESHPSTAVVINPETREYFRTLLRRAGLP